VRTDVLPETDALRRDQDDYVPMCYFERGEFGTKEVLKIIPVRVQYGRWFVIQLTEPVETDDEPNEAKKYEHKAQQINSSIVSRASGKRPEKITSEREAMPVSRRAFRARRCLRWSDRQEIYFDGPKGRVSLLDFLRRAVSLSFIISCSPGGLGLAVGRCPAALVMTRSPLATFMIVIRRLLWSRLRLWRISRNIRNAWLDVRGSHPLEPISTRILDAH